MTDPKKTIQAGDCLATQTADERADEFNQSYLPSRYLLMVPTDFAPGLYTDEDDYPVTVCKSNGKNYMMLWYAHGDTPEPKPGEILLENAYPTAHRIGERAAGDADISTVALDVAIFGEECIGDTGIPMAVLDMARCEDPDHNAPEGCGDKNCWKAR